VWRLALDQARDHAKAVFDQRLGLVSPAPLRTTRDQIVFLICIDLNNKSPDFGERQY
jgi:hypothetical protein